MHTFVLVSSSLLFLIGAGLFTKGVGRLEAYPFERAVGGDLAESGSGPGSYDVRKMGWSPLYSIIFKRTRRLTLVLLFSSVPLQPGVPQPGGQDQRRVGHGRPGRLRFQQQRDLLDPVCLLRLLARRRCQRRPHEVARRTADGRSVEDGRAQGKGTCTAVELE